MGEPKLLLPWAGHTVIDQVLRIWTESSVDHVVIVVRRGDANLRRVCEKWPVSVVAPLQDPRDMKESLLVGLEALDETVGPSGHHACFFSPADVPGISHRLIEPLLECYRRLLDVTGGNAAASPLVVPRFGGRPGHPSLFAWEATKQIAALGRGEGLNCLVERLPKHYVDFAVGERLPDIDTPAEYRKLRRGTCPAEEKNSTGKRAID